MQIVYERCAGLDVHKKSVVACLITPGPDGEPRKERQTFSTMTPDLVHLREWLTAQQCSQVAMESTGVYWRPIFNVLEGHLEVMVVNAQRVLCRAWAQDGRQRCSSGLRTCSSTGSYGPALFHRHGSAWCVN